jgi:DNA-binding GntR family transcriptional regulator
MITTYNMEMGDGADRVQFKSLNRRQISQEAYRVLREKILTCELIPGQRLAVESIAQQLGVSRTPVKDALAVLSAERLVDIQSRKGTFVTPIHPEEIRESFEVREALEAKSCELLGGKIDTEKLGILRDLIGKVSAPGVSLQENATLDARFHELLVRYSGNRKLLDLYLQLSAHLQIARVHYSSDNWRNRLHVSREEHIAILNALGEGDLERAAKLLKLHIRASMERLIQDITAATSRT